jgi:hypothetical protein
MITSQGNAFKGHPKTVAPWFPFVAPSPLSFSGALLGTCMRSNRLMWIDPAQLMIENVINGQVGQIFSPRNHGKTTLMKSEGIRLSGVQGGNRFGIPRKPRLIVDDRKPEIKDESEDGTQMKYGLGEYSLFGEFIGAKTLHLSEMPSINIFYGLDSRRALDMAIKVCEQDKGDWLNAFERWVLLIAINKMYGKFEAAISPGMLELCLNTLNENDRDMYYNEQDEKLLKQQAEAISYDAELERSILQLMDCERDGAHDTRTREERNVDLAKFRETAGELGVNMSNMQAGGVIGNEDSLFDVMLDQRVLWDWTAVSRGDRTILEFLRQTAQDLSLSRPDLDIIPDVRLGDEERSVNDEIIHLRHRLEYVEKARAFRTFDLTSVQFEHGMADTAGAVGSVERGIVELINKGTAIRFFGKQPYDEEHLDGLSKYGIADHDLFLMTELEQGCWAIQTGGARRVQFFRHLLTPSELPLVQSNAAARRQTDRIPLSEDDFQPSVISPNTIRRMALNGETVQVTPQD